MAKRAAIIFNPISGKEGRRKTEALDMVRLLAARGIDAQPVATSGPADATRLTREALNSGTDVIVCYGGDGTINEVIQAMAGSNAPLAVWAGGTSNVIAREIGVPFDKTRLSEVIAAGKTRRVPLGLATSRGAEKQRSRGAEGQESRGTGEQRGRGEALPPGFASSSTEPAAGRYFLMMAGIGLDASVARGVNRKLKRRAGELAYWLSGIKHLLYWKPENFTIDVDGRRFESAFAVVGKGKGYGGEMTMTPGAVLGDPEFEVFILPALGNNLAYLRVLMACMRGKPESTGATIIKGRQVYANSTHDPWVEVDGEVIGPLPMSFEVVPDALSLIVP